MIVLNSHETPKLNSGESYTALNPNTSKTFSVIDLAELSNFGY